MPTVDERPVVSCYDCGQRLIWAKTLFGGLELSDAMGRLMHPDGSVHDPIWKPGVERD